MTVRCFIDGIDWLYHLGSDPRGTRLFPSVEECRDGKGCLKEGGGCGIVEVEVRLIRWVEEQREDTLTNGQRSWPSRTVPVQKVSNDK